MTDSRERVVLTVRCGHQRRGRPCRAWLARVLATPHGRIVEVRSWHRDGPPTIERIPWERLFPDDLWYDACCPEHQRIEIPAGELRARSARATRPRDWLVVKPPWVAPEDRIPDEAWGAAPPDWP